MRPVEKKLFCSEIAIGTVLLALTVIGVLKIIAGSLIAVPLSVITAACACMILEDADHIRKESKQRDGLRGR